MQFRPWTRYTRDCEMYMLQKERKRLEHPDQIISMRSVNENAKNTPIIEPNEIKLYQLTKRTCPTLRRDIFQTNADAAEEMQRSVA